MRNPLANEMYSYLQDQTQQYFLTVVFGSYARDEAHSSSDLDVLLIDESFDGWTVHQPNSSNIIDWNSDFQDLHLLTCSKDEFESRYCNQENMVRTISDEGFAVNTSFGLVDYLTEIKMTNSF
jgi:hypothetical protein